MPKVLFDVPVSREGVTVVGDDQLTPHEVGQQALQPAANAVYDYTETSVAANTHLTELGIDVETMAVVVYWVGGRLDQETDAAFAKIAESTGTPITVVSTRFSREEFFSAMDEIVATQEGVNALSAENGQIIVEVDPDSPLSGRPSEVAVAGKNEPIPVHYKHSVVQPLAMPTDRQ